MNRAIFAALCLSVVLLPLPYGSVEAWSIEIFETAAFGLFGLYLLSEYVLRPAKRGGRDGAPLALSPGSLEDDSRPGRSKSFTILAGLVAAFFVLTTFQIVPLPAGFVKALSSRAFEIRGQSGAASGALALSLSPVLTAMELVKFAAYLLFAVLVYRLVDSRVRAEIFVGALLVSGLFQALYGLAEFWSGSGRIFGWKNLYNQVSAFGTYVNRNHFAGFLEMVFPLALGYLLAKVGFSRIPRHFSLKRKIVWLAQERLPQVLLLCLPPVILGLGIVFSFCRTGVLILTGSIFLMAFLAGPSKRSRSEFSGPPTRSRTIRFIFAGVLLVSLASGLSTLSSRFAADTLSKDQNRIVYYKNTLDLIRSFPLFGSGAGTFVYAYPLVEKADEPRILAHAHNDYLETLSDSGVPAGGAIILAALASFGVLVSRWRRRRDPFVRGVGLGVLTGILAMLIHSLMDFNLRIPANAVVFLSLFALAFRVISLKRRKIQNP